jgi:hypothetical protein
MELRTEADWRVVLEIETEDGAGTRRRMLLDLPRGDFSLPELHELAREGADAMSILTEETTDVVVRVSFPEDLEAHLLARLKQWHGIYRLVRDGAPPS